VYSQAARSKFILIIVGNYISLTIYYYYTKGDKSDADDTAYIRLTASFAKMSRLNVCKPLHNTVLLKYNYHE